VSIRDKYLRRLKYIINKGEPMPAPTQIPEWPNEWKDFGDEGSQMKKIEVGRADTTMYLFRSNSGTYMRPHNHIPTEVCTVITGRVEMGLFIEGRWKYQIMEPGESVSVPGRMQHDCNFLEDSLISLMYVPMFDEDTWEAK